MGNRKSEQIREPRGTSAATGEHHNPQTRRRVCPHSSINLCNTRFSSFLPHPHRTKKKWLPCLPLSLSLPIRVALPYPKLDKIIRGLPLRLILPWLSRCHPPNPLSAPLIRRFCKLGSQLSLQ